MKAVPDSMDMGGGRTLRPVRLGEVGLLRGLIVEAIDASPYYNDDFKASEKSRLSENFLRALIVAHPWYVSFVLFKSEIAGFVLLIPDQGILWASWIYVRDKFRRTAAAVTSVGALVRYWDNGPFHKVVSLIRPENTTAAAVLLRYGFTQNTLMKNHFFGEDYLLLERPFNKTEPGYPAFSMIGRLGSMRLRLKGFLGG